MPAIAIGFSTSFNQLLIFGLFARRRRNDVPRRCRVHFALVPPEKQGAALGVYGMGNIGQSIAVFGRVMAARGFGGGCDSVFCLRGESPLFEGVGFFVAAHHDASDRRPKSLVWKSRAR